MEAIDLKQKLSMFDDFWNPKIVGELNNQFVKLVKLKGEFIWHKHEQEDEMFFVVKGEFTLKLRDEDIKISEGQFYIVPHGIEHKPVAEEECHVMLFEPKSVLNTGDLINSKTVKNLDRI